MGKLLKVLSTLIQNQSLWHFNHPEGFFRDTQDCPWRVVHPTFLSLEDLSQWA